MTDIAQRANVPAPARPAASVTSSGDVLTIEEAAAALQVLRHGGVDEATTKLALSPAIRATVSPFITALRWAAVMFGLVFAAPDAADGDLAVVSTLTIVLFFTTWRTFRPLRLASERRLYRNLAVTDGIIVGAAVGISGGFDSPYVFCVLAAGAVAAFGWGLAMGALVTAVSVVAMAVVGIPTNAGLNLDDQQSLAILASMIIVLALLGFARNRLLEAERRRARLAGRLDMLAETNDLLHILNQVARTLPTSLDLREALAATRSQISRAFDASVICLVITDSAGEFTPQITENCALPTRLSAAELPVRMRQALEAPRAILVGNLGGTGVGEHAATGVYTALKTRGQVVGILAVEHETEGRYSERELRIIDGLSEVLGLTVDNARWFRRLRTLGAEEERTRIARDLHDRLGQWLTYIGFELERIMSSESGNNPELSTLHDDVQRAIDELRETLRQLRSGVNEDVNLAHAARDLITRFSNRTGTKVTFRVADAEASLPVPIENELLRIVQEALNNIEKHAQADHVRIEWNVRDDQGELTITDNGKGFDTRSGVRESAYGLVGMQERCDVIGAELSITSAPGRGTRIHVVATVEGAV